ncbi:unnamed protein product [Chrysoparadoxa australica]
MGSSASSVAACCRSSCPCAWMMGRSGGDLEGSEQCKNDSLYKQRLKAMEEDQFRLNIILYGECSVGKTCLRNRWVEGRFTPDVAATVGVDFNVKHLEWETSSNGRGNDEAAAGGKSIVKVNVYDTSGKAGFRRINASYLKAFQAVVFTYDVTSEESFLSLVDFLDDPDTKKHLEKVQGKVPQMLMLLGNKSDMPISDRQVGIETGENTAAKLGMVFAEASAKSGEGVDGAFNTVVKAVVQRMQEHRDQAQDEDKGLQKVGSLRALVMARDSVRKVLMGDKGAHSKRMWGLEHSPSQGPLTGSTDAGRDESMEDIRLHEKSAMAPAFSPPTSPRSPTSRLLAAGEMASLEEQKKGARDGAYAAAASLKNTSSFLLGKWGIKKSTNVRRRSRSPSPKGLADQSLPGTSISRSISPSPKTLDAEVVVEEDEDSESDAEDSFTPTRAPWREDARPALQW